jgi:hypothetical protein
MIKGSREPRSNNVVAKADNVGFAFILRVAGCAPPSLLVFALFGIRNTAKFCLVILTARISRHLPLMNSRIQSITKTIVSSTLALLATY